MNAVNTACSVSDVTLGKSMRAVRLESDQIAATILIDKGADIFELVYRPRQIDVLWKTPWGINERGRGAVSVFSSEAAWLESYPGGWQDIFPNGGDACLYKGGELNFHGEASTVGWDLLSSTAHTDFAEIELGVRLYRSPFRIHRTMRVEAGRPTLILTERITNEGREHMDYMWGFHPAYGAPFLGSACRIDTGARAFCADSSFDGTGNPLTLGEHYTWPIGQRDGAKTDMSIVPAADPEHPRFAQAYLSDFESGWYAITNTELGFGIGLTWPTDVFPYAWLWQEMYASPGFPFYGNAYTMAIEPFSSIPGLGLLTAMEAGTHRTLAPGETVEADVKAIFFESSRGVEHIDRDGTVFLR
jgi:galactose mutarotase-like enzyme